MQQATVTIPEGKILRDMLQGDMARLRFSDRRQLQSVPPWAQERGYDKVAGILIFDAVLQWRDAGRKKHDAEVQIAVDATASAKHQLLMMVLPDSQSKVLLDNLDIELCI